ncbi:winged helix-turn-helix transcriptional regulator [Bacillus cytotoxicus]|uniref:winged helix-turn-helix transcriptional regulator n=1 Tax=unclassified Bacillus cereus group TaxID=2750818 RepID=UPI001F58C969|nr:MULTISPECIES: helix-turn-helix domain-containing protein [unclassified Bacillus cereus group]EMA6341903.1 helix-turn-helix transcriptional regulator [Bacillus cytotoxicus]
MGKDLRDEVLQKIKNKEFHCAKELTLSIISGKWKIVILYRLGLHGPMRFSAIQQLFPKITHKVLTKQLRELEDDGVVTRKVYPEVPPKVEYSLTELGESLQPILQMMYDWGEKRIKQLKQES